MRPSALRQPRRPAATAFSVTSMTRRRTDGDDRRARPTGATERARRANADDQTMTDQPPEGRTSTTTLDRLARPRRSPATGVTPIVSAYDERGPLTSAKQGAAATTFAYDARTGCQRTDAAGNSVGYVYDDADRVTESPAGQRDVHATPTTPTAAADDDDAGGRTRSPSGDRRPAATEAYAPPGQSRLRARLLAGRELLDDRAAVRRRGAARLRRRRPAARRTTDLQAKRTFATSTARTSSTRSARAAPAAARRALDYGYDGILPTAERRRARPTAR